MEGAAELPARERRQAKRPLVEQSAAQPRDGVQEEAHVQLGLHPSPRAQRQQWQPGKRYLQQQPLAAATQRLLDPELLAELTHVQQLVLPAGSWQGGQRQQQATLQQQDHRHQHAFLDPRKEQHAGRMGPAAADLLPSELLPVAGPGLPGCLPSTNLPAAASWSVLSSATCCTTAGREAAMQQQQQQQVMLMQPKAPSWWEPGQHQPTAATGPLSPPVSQLQAAQQPPAGFGMSATQAHAVLAHPPSMTAGEISMVPMSAISVRCS